MIELKEDPVRERTFRFKNLPVDHQLLNGEILRLEEQSGRLEPGGDHALRLAVITAFGPASRLRYLEELAGEVERKTIYIGDNCLFKQITKAQPKPVREPEPNPEPKPAPKPAASQEPEPIRESVLPAPKPEPVPETTQPESEPERPQREEPVEFSPLLHCAIVALMEPRLGDKVARFVADTVVGQRIPFKVEAIQAAHKVKHPNFVFRPLKPAFVNHLAEEASQPLADGEEPVLVDPDAIRERVVQTLKSLFLKDFTAYQMARLIGADDRAPRTVLSTLADQRESTGVLQSRVTTREGKSKTLYRYYPFTVVSGQPVALPADVRGFVLNLLHKQGAQNQTAILCHSRWFFRRIDDHVLRESLVNLERRGRINVERGPRNAKIYTLVG